MGEVFQQVLVLQGEFGAVPGTGLFPGFSQKLIVRDQGLHAHLQVGLLLGWLQVREDFVGMEVEIVVEDGLVGTNLPGQAIRHLDIGLPALRNRDAGLLLGSEPGGEAAQTLVGIARLMGVLADIVGFQFHLSIHCCHS